VSPRPGPAWALGDPAALEVVSETDRHGRPLRTVIDMDTGLVRNDPVPGDAELATFYAEEYRTAYKGAARPRGRQALRNFRRAAAHIRGFADVYDGAGRVLDVGAGSGEFAYLMAARGKAVTGIEPNRGYAEYCRETLGLDVQTAHLAPDLFAAGRFDLIRLNHVLEHLNDPVRYLAMIAAWLAPGGTLYVEVPNIETYAREKSRGNMFHYGHIFNFNPWTLRAAAGLAGLDERADTRARCAGTTGVFLQVAGGPGAHPTDARGHGGPGAHLMVEGREDGPGAHPMGDGGADTRPATGPANPENAEKVRDLIRRHYAGAFRKGKAMKPLSKLAARVEEMIGAGLAGGPRAIGDKIARTL